MNPARIELLALIAVALAVFLILDHRFGKGRKTEGGAMGKARRPQAAARQRAEARPGDPRSV